MLEPTDTPTDTADTTDKAKDGEDGKGGGGGEGGEAAGAAGAAGAAKAALTEDEYKMRQTQEHVALIIMSKFRSNVFTTEVLEEKLTSSVLQERALVLRLAAKLLDAMLISICFPQRALAATHATLKLTAEFASGLWNAQSEECMKLQIEQVRSGPSHSERTSFFKLN